MNEIFTPVPTSPQVPANSDCLLLRDDGDELTVHLKAPDDACYRVQFSMPLACQVTDEGDRLRSMEYLNGGAATPVGRIENSRWLKWFVEQ